MRPALGSFRVRLPGDAHTVEDSRTGSEISDQTLLGIEAHQTGTTEAAPPRTAFWTTTTNYATLTTNVATSTYAYAGNPFATTSLLTASKAPA